MAKMWAGRTDGVTDAIADAFNSSITFDARMALEDIQGSIAHAAMLAKQGILSQSTANHITEGLCDIAEDLKSGKLNVDPSSEDIHMFVEKVLTERIGDEGKQLHTARSRNDQVTLDLRMYTRNQIEEIHALLKEFILVLTNKAEEYKDAIMPGYTHLQRAQPVTFGHHLMAYCMMFLRDLERLEDDQKRINCSPIGCCALAGTTYDTDRFFEAQKLGFSAVSENSLDGVSDRDFVAETIFDLSLLMMHLSRLSEEYILWSSWEFKFIELDDAYTTGSSIMPQKKNPDMSELMRGKTGRVYGDLITILTVLKGLPLAYNKDMQEDKECLFDALDTVEMCLKVVTPMTQTLRALPENMRKAAGNGFINATDLADYLTKKGMPFRDAYKISGQIVAECIEKGKTLETFSLEEYKVHSSLFEEDVYKAVDLDTCLNQRTSYGGPCVASVERQIETVRGKLQ